MQEHLNLKNIIHSYSKLIFFYNYYANQFKFIIISRFGINLNAIFKRI